MKRAREIILQEYKEGRRDFQGVSLRGLSFKRKNLSEADFSGADIRGTNFRGANLTKAKFQGAKGGLQKRWLLVFLIVAFILAVISGLFSSVNGVFVNLIFSSDVENPIYGSILEDKITGWVGLITTIVFWVFVIRWGIIASFGFVAVAGAIAVAVAGPVAAAGTFPVAGTFAIAVAGALAVAGPVAVAGAFAFAVAGAFAFAFAVTVAFAVAVAVAGAFAGAVAVTIILLSAYVAFRAMKGDEKYAFIRNVAIAFAALCGTSFRNANLTDADFTNATLKSTDFRGANITRTCWKNTIKLDRIRPGEKYLKDAKVRELVRTEEGQDKNFYRFDFRGINLKEANLQGASFFGTDLNRANLQNANLSTAKLVQTLLEGADLTGATLTGACVEDWAISNTTKLIDINCDYIFLKYPDRERRPADSDKYFEPGEFAKLAQKIPNTVDLIFKDGIDWQTFLKTFEELRVESETEELPVIQTIENKGDGAFVIRVKVSDKIDEAEYERKFWQKYKPMLELKDERIKLLSEQNDFYSEEIKNKRKQIKKLRKDNTKLMGIVETMAEKENQGYQIDIQENHGPVGNTGQTYGVVGAVGNKGKINDLKTAHTINETPQKTLAETAAEIQQLLKQLEQSNPTETTAGQMAVATQAIEIVENNPTLKQRVIGVLKSAGTEAFKEALDNPIANVLVAAFQGWIEP